MTKKEIKNKIKQLSPLNPFISNDFKLIVNTLIDKKTFQHTTDGVLLHKQFYFEAQTICKIIKTPENRKLIASLSAPALKLYNWLIYELNPNKDYITINKNRAKLELNINSDKTFYKALAELNEKKIICNSDIKNTYFINPKIFFCGNRVKMYPDNILVYKAANKKNKTDKQT